MVPSFLWKAFGSIQWKISTLEIPNFTVFVEKSYRLGS